MSLLTRCPACSTIYKVVPDQLRISQGWVKCGQCGDIFDATQHLVHIEAMPPVQSRDPAQAHATRPMETDALRASSQERERLDIAAQLKQEAPVDEDVEQNVSVAEFERTREFDDPQVSTGAGSQATGEPDYEAFDPRTDQAAAQVENVPENASLGELAKTDHVLPDATLGSEEPSFVRHARRVLFWRRPWVRVVLLVWTLVLLLGLVVQWIYQERHLLSASHPQLVPALQKFCEVTGCALAPMQRIESVVIDAASFNQIATSRYRLSVTLKNSAEVPLAPPSIELTLTDLQERVVVRRVFAARELDNSVNLLRPASVWQVDIALNLSDEAIARRVVGYRVLAFYP